MFTNVSLAQELTFKEIDNLNLNSKSQIETFLKKRNYLYVSTESHSIQWKSKQSGDLIQFNSEGVLLFSTYTKQVYLKMIYDLKNSSYEYSRKSKIDGIDAQIYSNSKSKIFLTSIKNPISGKQSYKLTFLKN